MPAKGPATARAGADVASFFGASMGSGLAANGGDLSVWGLAVMADPVVKLVMLILLGASVWCWAIIVDKAIRLRRIRQASDAFEERFWSGIALDKLYDEVNATPEDPIAATFCAGMDEWRHAVAKNLFQTESMRSGVQQRLERNMEITVQREMDRLERQMTVLASVGSVSPFVGLFGTVWGIMNSFASIAATRETSLAVVAPGIAEALFATALGLFAAIPAVVAFNKFNNDLTRYGDRLDAFAQEFSAILSRHMQERT